MAILVEKALKMYQNSQKQDELLIQILNQSGKCYYSARDYEKSRAFLIKAYQLQTTLPQISFCTRQTNYIYLLKTLVKMDDSLNVQKLHHELETFLQDQDTLTYDHLYLGYKQLVMNCLYLSKLENSLFHVEKALLKFNNLTHNLNLKKKEEESVKNMVTTMFSARFIKLSYL